MRRARQPSAAITPPLWHAMRRAHVGISPISVASPSVHTQCHTNLQTPTPAHPPHPQISYRHIHRSIRRHYECVIVARCDVTYLLRLGHQLPPQPLQLPRGQIQLAAQQLLLLLVQPLPPRRSTRKAAPQLAKNNSFGTEGIREGDEGASRMGLVNLPMNSFWDPCSTLASKTGTCFLTQRGGEEHVLMCEQAEMGI